MKVPYICQDCGAAYLLSDAQVREADEINGNGNRLCVCGGDVCGGEGCESCRLLAEQGLRDAHQGVLF